MNSTDDRPQQKPTHDWLEGAWAILGANGVVLNANAPMRAALGLGATTGQDPTPFWSLLEKHLSLRPPPDITADPAPPFAEVRLTASRPEAAPDRWFRLEIARHHPVTVVRLASCLPPRPELAETSWETHLVSESARREMFVRLLRAESRLEQLTEYWPGIVFSQRADGTFDFVSPKVETLTGVSSAQWQRQAQWLWDVVHEADAAELERQLQQAARTGRPVTTTFRVRHLQSGRISYVLEHRQPITSSSGLLLGYEGVWLDVTRQTIAERRLSSAAWKETLAVLTMGLAHDFGNIMAGIHSLSESFLEQLKEGDPMAQGLSLIKKNSMQASQLVHRIINLHLGKSGERNYHDLNAIVEELQDLVRKIVPRRIQLEVRLAPGQLPVYVDAVEFRQTIINLTLNAADAMPEKGRLEIATSRHTAWSPPLHVEGCVPRLPCVCLTVRDNGCGIKPRHLHSIFDPFFTTKSANKGSGLGLYNARLFVDKSHGALSVESAEGDGTTFHLWLPEADFSEAERQSGAEPGAPLRRLTLLLLGSPGRPLDETTELLRTQNYHVVTAATAEAALQALRAGDCIYSGLMVLIEADDAAATGLLSTVRRQYPMLKLMLKLVGQDQEDLRADCARQADLVISASEPDQAFLRRLEEALKTEA